MQRKIILYFALLVLVAGSGMAIMVGNPTKETPYERFGFSVEFDYEKWLIRYEIGPDYKINSQRILLKPSLGLFRFVEANAILGMADLNFPSISSVYTDFNGSQELAFGLGLKTHFAYYYPAFGCRRISKQPVRLYAIANWLTTVSSDEVIFGGGVLHYVDSYRFQQFDMSLYGSWQFGRTVPYLGIKWTYLTGRKYRKAYSASSGTPFTKMSGLFNDPGQYPKPILGLDIDIGKGYVLTLEASYWGKSETTIGIGLSQLYYPKKDKDDEDAPALQGVGSTSSY
ncbi:hypothetical protein KAH81_05975 [bacterium]|nr:hypothetical protein [bacterium]